MGFWDSLNRNPSGSGIYDSGGGGGGFTAEDLFANDAELRRRDMNDFRQKNQFMADLSNRQPNARNVFNPEGGMKQATAGMNTYLKEDPDRITPFQQAGLNLKKEDLGIDRAKLAQSGKLGEEKLALSEKGHELDVKKNQQIFDTKHADMQRKSDEANSKLDLAERQLQSRQGDAMALAARHKAELDARTAQHELDNYRKDQALADTQKKHEAEIAAMNERLRQSRGSKTKTSLNAEGTEKTVETTKGDNQDEDDPLGILK